MRVLTTLADLAADRHNPGALRAVTSYAVLDSVDNADTVEPTIIFTYEANITQFHQHIIQGQYLLAAVMPKKN